MSSSTPPSGALSDDTSDQANQGVVDKNTLRAALARARQHDEIKKRPPSGTRSRKKKPRALIKPQSRYAAQGKVSLKRPVLLATFLRRIAWRLSRLLVWMRSSELSKDNGGSTLVKVIEGAHLLLNMFSTQENLGYQHWRVLNDFIVRMYTVTTRDQENFEALAEYTESVLSSLFNSDNNIRHSAFLTICLWRFAIRNQIVPVTEIHSMREKALSSSGTHPDIEFTLISKLIPKFKLELTTGWDEPSSCRLLDWNSTNAKDLRDLISRDLYRSRRNRLPTPLILSTAVYMSYGEDSEGLNDMVDLLTTLGRDFVDPFIIQSGNEKLEEYNICLSAPVIQNEILLRMRMIDLAGGIFKIPVDIGLEVLDGDDMMEQQRYLTSIFIIKSNVEVIERLALDFVRLSQFQTGSLPFIAFGISQKSPADVIGASVRAKIIEEALEYCPLTIRDWAAITYLACDESVRNRLQDGNLIQNLIHEFQTGRQLPEYKSGSWNQSACGPAMILMSESTRSGLFNLDRMTRPKGPMLDQHEAKKLEQAFTQTFDLISNRFTEAYSLKTDEMITAKLLLNRLFGLGS